MSKIHTIYNILKYKMLENSWKGVKYLHYKSGRKTLLIIFSAMPPNNIRVYNYVRGLNKLPLDRLYIKDTWGYRGSYYLYENGEMEPYQKTCCLIEKIIREGNYENIITAGTSKGGSSAIIFGLKYNAIHIFSGACQYHIGDYLGIPIHSDILKAMKGNLEDKEIIDRLNRFFLSTINQYGNIWNGNLHLIYSKQEHTYKEHLVDLIDQLKRNNINIIEKEYH